MKGEIRIRATCLLPEKLLRSALDEGATFCSAERPDARTLCVSTDAAGARILLSVCERFSIPARVTARRGRSAVLDYARRRATLALGILVFVALCALFLGRIWAIDYAFSGDEAARGDPALFAEALRDMGIRPGCAIPKDPALIAERLEAAADGYSFVGVRVQGIRLLVEAVPELPAPQVYDVESARDLLSACDGIVVSAEARSGTLCVSPGDTVRRGQLLIRGEEKASKEGMRPIAALGEVVVRCWVAGRSELPAAKLETSDTGRTASRSRLRISDWEIPLSACDDFPSQRVETLALPIGGLFLPVEIVKSVLWETRAESVPVDPNRMNDQLVRLAFADAALRLQRDGPKEYTVERTWYDVDPPSGGMRRARAVYEIHTDAAVSREALLQGG